MIPYTVLYENGQAFWICRSESAFLAVAGSEIGGYFRLTVLVGNATAEPVTFFPEAIQVTDLNTGRALPYTSPEKIAQRIEHRLAVASALMAFGNGLQAYSNSMVTVHTTGTLSMFDNHGSWAQGSFYGTATTRVPVGRGRDISCLIPPAQNPHERSLAHAALISDDWRRSVARDKGGARVEKEATAWQLQSCVPTSPHAFDCGDTERATTC